MGFYKNLDKGCPFYKFIGDKIEDINLKQFPMTGGATFFCNNGADLVRNSIRPVKDPYDCIDKEQLDSNYFNQFDFNGTHCQLSKGSQVFTSENTKMSLFKRGSNTSVILGS